MSSTTNSTLLNKIILAEGADFPNHMLFAKYEKAGPNSALIVPALLMNIAGVPGIVANFLLIWVTCRKNTLRGSTNFLLALTAFFEILHQSAHLLFLIVTLSGINFLPYGEAVYFQLHSIFGLTAAQTVMASTAGDRLLSVLIPWSYEQINGIWYLLAHTFLAFCCGAWMAWNALIFAGQHPTLPVTGYISDLLVEDMEVEFKFIMTLCGVNMVLYALVWLVVKIKAKGSTQQQSRLLKSLVLIVLIVIGGYVLNNVCRLVVNHAFQLDDIQVWSINVFGGLLLNIGASAETPTLYLFSTDYRNAINQECARIFRGHKIQPKNSAIVSSMYGKKTRREQTVTNTLSTMRRASGLGQKLPFQAVGPRRGINCRF